MKVPIYQVDAFTDQTFKGNPAAVCPLDGWPEDSILQNIAAENNLSETAFFVKNDVDYQLRWFTPVLEIDLCGHATLASAHVLFNHLHYDQPEVKFITKSGELTVTKEGEYLLLNIPSWESESIETPKELVLGLGAEPQQVYKPRDVLAVFETEEEVKNLEPDFHILSTVETLGIIATAPGNDVDFVSRFFVPQAGINEDPVTGSAHSSLVPYWSKVLEKTSMKAKQISKRGGDLFCELKEDRVILRGKAVTYLVGDISF